MAVWVHPGPAGHGTRSPCRGKLGVFLAWSREQGRIQSLLPGRKSSGVAGAAGKGSGAFPELRALSRAG